jgi:endonuclease/exonuclease/phosphatase family metal-dependent hydrolase
MKRKKLSFAFILSIFFIILFLFISFLKWNDDPPLPVKYNPAIIKLNFNNNLNNQATNLKVVSYNIHYGIGFDIKTIKTSKMNYLTRLNKIAHILKDIDADIVLLQEVDFQAARSFSINQGKYLANKAGYNFIAPATTLRKKIHLSFNIIGKINHGLCILSKYPIEKNEVIVFEPNDEIPFFAKWLYDPHGAQKCSIKYQNKLINVINLHLEPWSQQLRENQIKLIKNNWLTHTNIPTIIGGDFNALSPTAKKEGLYMKDAPWFIDRTKWNIKNDITIPILTHAGFKESDPTILSFKIKNFTYPSNNPKEKIDFIFAGNKTRIIKGFVFNNAKIASDHLPIVALIKINNN